MDSLFNDILGRAEKLSTANYQEQIGAEPSSSTGRPQWIASQTLDSDLRSIFRASENLWNNAKSRSLQKDILFGEKGVVFGVTAPTLEESIAPSATTTEDEEFDMDVKRVKLDAEKAFFNHVLLTKPHATLSSAKRTQRDETMTTTSQPAISEVVTSRRELLLGDKIRRYVKSGKKRDLAELLNSINADSNTDTTFVSIWTETVALINQKTIADRDDLTTCIQLIGKACDYLHSLYIVHMTDVVDRNRVIAERGGVPGTTSLVTAYLKISPDHPEAEDGIHDGMPIWEVAYNCFRAGDLQAAKPALVRLQTFPQCAILVQALTHLTKYNTLDAEIKKKLKVEWRHNQGMIRDKFKRGLYIALLGGDSELADTVENWIWFKLITLKVDPQVSTSLYSDLQKMVSIDFGEDYFMRNGEYQYYFTALWLSGQFERAIDVLANSGLLCEAVHIAILANEMGYLRCITVDSTHPTKAFLNLPRLIVIYTKEFELADPARALDYCFLLRGFKTPSGSDVFEKAVSRMVYLMDNNDFTSQLLGSLEPDGRRKAGLIDEYVDDPSSVIETVAQDVELNGHCEEAVYIYLLANRPNKAVNMLSSGISENLRINLQQAKRLRDAAKQYEQLLANADAKDFSTLSTLNDILRIFEACEQRQCSKAYKWTSEIRLIPTVCDAVPVIVREFHMVPQEVREVIPDFCLTYMKALVEHLNIHREAAYIEQVRAIVLYVATVPYKFPQHINSDILKLQSAVAV